LNAVGIKHPALISTAREADEDVPAGQFDHVLTVVPGDSKLLWLDTTTEVGPYQYLVSAPRQTCTGRKPSLIGYESWRLPFASAQSFVMEAKLMPAACMVMPIFPFAGTRNMCCGVPSGEVPLPLERTRPTDLNGSGSAAK
jgi:hypothetical protein